MVQVGLLCSVPLLPKPLEGLPCHQQALGVLQEQLSLVQELLVGDLWHALNYLQQAESLVWRQRWAHLYLLAPGLGWSRPCLTGS